MKVSFDLDETLFVNPEKVKTEKNFPFPLNRIFKDRLRKGAVELLKWINKKQFELWIYTTSYRTEMYIRNYFRYYGIKIDHIVNAQRHEKEVQKDRKVTLPSKYPSAYHIDLHVDDELSVYQNGIACGFKVYLLKNDDKEWTGNLKAYIERINNSKNF